MQYTYGVIFLLSLVLLPLYFLCVRKKQREPWLLGLFVCVCVVNLGYTLIAFSGTVEFALLANKIAYLGQVFMPLCMFMMIWRLCGYQYKKWMTGALIGVAVVMLAIVCTTGYLDWYYVSAEIEFVAGAAVLRKEYGVLHPTNLIYVIAYFLAMIVVVCLSLAQRKGAAQKHACIMLAIVLGNIGLWCIQKVIPWEFELLSAIYLISALAFLFLWLMLQDYVHKKDIPKYTPAEEKQLGMDIVTMPMQQKLGKVLLCVRVGEAISHREHEILELILDNKRRREIAQHLCLSENTVKTYTRTLYSKLGVSSREELYALVLQKQPNNE
jgi:DNA-binding CsgD family transcriptional regulator